MKLKRITLADAKDHFEIYSNRANMKFYDLRPFDSITQSKDLIRKCLSEAALRRRFTRGIYVENRLVGVLNALGLTTKRRSCRLGYILSRKYQGRGIMTEALPNFLKELHVRHRIRSVGAEVLPGNKASLALLRRLGFTKTGTVTKEIQGRRRQLVRFGHRLTNG